MSNLVPLHAELDVRAGDPQEELIAALEAALAHARSGQLQGMAGVFMDSSGAVWWNNLGIHGTYQQAGAAHALAAYLTSEAEDVR